MPLKPFKSRKTREEQLLDKIYYDPNSGCWLFTGSLNSSGYGNLCLSSATNKRTEAAHRVSWEIHRGPIPKGKWVLHKCDTRPCINPEHLYLGGRKENLNDALKRARFPRGEKIPGATTTNAQAKQVKELLKLGTPVAEIARALKIPYLTVYNIRRGKWKYA